MKTEFPIANLSNQALLEITERLAADVHRATAKLIAALAEVDARKLWADVGCSSLYTFCTEVLRFSEQEAYLRMEAARVVRRFPIALAMLDDGALTMTTIGLLKRHLTAENHAELLEGARGKTKREVARQIATLRTDDGPLQPASIRMLTLDRYTVEFEIGGQTYDRLQRATDLLRHAVPDRCFAEIFDRALMSLVRRGPNQTSLGGGASPLWRDVGVFVPGKQYFSRACAVWWACCRDIHLQLWPNGSLQSVRRLPEAVGISSACGSRP